MLFILQHTRESLTQQEGTKEGFGKSLHLRHRGEEEWSSSQESLILDQFSLFREGNRMSQVSPQSLGIKNSAHSELVGRFS